MADLACSFCGKTKDETLSLIAGARGFICSECVRLCVEIVAAEKGALPQGKEWLRQHKQLVDRLVSEHAP
jgi:ATP-dependent protease Clp ATPase subunit